MLGEPLTIADVSAELRLKAVRLRPELNPPYDPAEPDEKAFPPEMLLAIAMIDAVNEKWDRVVATADSQTKAVYERAIELARAAHPDLERIVISGPRGQAPCVATVEARRYSTGPVEKDAVLALHYNLIFQRPLWVEYIAEASAQLYPEPVP